MVKQINRDGYTVWVTSVGDTFYEHREVAEMYLGRFLYAHEEVHHINGRKWDNNPENLCVMSGFHHWMYHGWYNWRFKTYGKYPSYQMQIHKLRNAYAGILIADLVYAETPATVPSFKLAK